MVMGKPAHGATSMSNGNCFLIAKPAKNSKGKIFRVIKDRYDALMPFHYYVQQHSLNYRHGKMCGSWPYVLKTTDRDEAVALYKKKIAK
jgi:hypothetical protein